MGVNAGGWERVTIGRSDALVERRGDMFRKTAPDIADEVARLQWCRAAGLPVPEVLEVSGNTMITRALPGRSGAEPWPVDQRPAVLTSVGRFLAKLQSVSIADCPFEGREADTSPVVDPVLTHGDFMLPNVLLDQTTSEVTGMVDLGRMGIADRHADVADMVFSITRINHPQYPSPMEHAFLDGYGSPVDTDLLAFYLEPSNRK